MLFLFGDGVIHELAKVKYNLTDQLSWNYDVIHAMCRLLMNEVDYEDRRRGLFVVDVVVAVSLINLVKSEKKNRLVLF